MPEVALRKRAIIVEDIFHECGPRQPVPLKRGAIVAVIRNPFAGRYVEEIAPIMEELKPLGFEMAQGAARGAGRRPSQHRELWQGRHRRRRAASSNMARSGMCPAAMRCARSLGDAKAIVPSTKKVGAPGTRWTCRSPTSTPAMCAAISTPSRWACPARPRPTRSLFILVMSTGSRVHARVGGLAASDVKGGRPAMNGDGA